MRYTRRMETITAQCLHTFNQAWLAIEQGSDPSGDRLERACRRLYEHIAGRMEASLAAAKTLSPEQLQTLIDELEADEQALAQELQPIERKVKKTLPRLRTLTPAERAAMESPLRTFLAHVPMLLEMIRDTRWQIMATHAERTRGAPAHSAGSVGEMRALFNQQLQ